MAKTTVKAKSANLKIQQWGNSLAVRIPSMVARAAHFAVGQPVEVAVKNNVVIVKSIGEPKLTLAQKLALFDASKYGGEVMAAHLIGVEIFK